MKFKISKKTIGKDNKLYLSLVVERDAHRGIKTEQFVGMIIIQDEEVLKQLADQLTKLKEVEIHGAE